MYYTLQRPSTSKETKIENIMSMLLPITKYFTVIGHYGQSQMKYIVSRHSCEVDVPAMCQWQLLLEFELLYSALFRSTVSSWSPTGLCGHWGICEWCIMQNRPRQIKGTQQIWMLGDYFMCSSYEINTLDFLFLEPFIFFHTKKVLLFLI